MSDNRHPPGYIPLTIHSLHGGDSGGNNSGGRRSSKDFGGGKDSSSNGKINRRRRRRPDQKHEESKGDRPRRRFRARSKFTPGSTDKQDESI